MTDGIAAALPAPSAEAAALHASAVVADTHNDLLMAVAARPPARWSSFFAERWLPQLRAGGVGVQVLPVFVDDAYRPEGALRRTLRMNEAAHRLAEGNADAVALCAGGAEIDAALGCGRIALVLALEGCPAVDTDVELLGTLFRLGVRVASLTHFGRSALADGSGEDATGGRLTRSGVAAVAEMERLGMILDVSHLGAHGVEHVLELAGRPVIATHSSARALRDHHRNLTDAQIAGVAATGGVVCVNFFAAFLHPTDHRIDRLADHIEHVARVAGIDHVGIGPDFVREVEEETTPPWQDDFVIEGVDTRACIPGLAGPAGLPLVTDALLRRGFAGGDVVKILGGNVLRLLRAELGVPAAARGAVVGTGAAEEPPGISAGGPATTGESATAAADGRETAAGARRVPDGGRAVPPGAGGAFTGTDGVSAAARGIPPGGPPARRPGQGDGEGGS